MATSSRGKYTQQRSNAPKSTTKPAAPPVPNGGAMQSTAESKEIPATGVVQEIIETKENVLTDSGNEAELIHSIPSSEVPVVETRTPEQIELDRLRDEQEADRLRLIAEREASEEALNRPQMPAAVTKPQDGVDFYYNNHGQRVVRLGHPETVRAAEIGNRMIVLEETVKEVQLTGSDRKGLVQLYFAGQELSPMQLQRVRVDR